MPEPGRAVADQPRGAQRLGLGTVQFGLDYGITNATGKVSQREAQLILEHAREKGARILDTAALYGDSEAVLGEIACDKHFDIVTKTPKFGGCGTAAEAADMLQDGFVTSLRKLRAPTVYALLVHDVNDLLGPFGDALWKRMVALRDQGLVRRIGMSTYEGHEIDTVLARYEPDLVQLPLNAIDLRLVHGGQLERLARRNIEVHVRSVFLQGLLLQPPSELRGKFAILRESITGLHECFTSAGLSVMEGLIGSVFTHPEVDRIIVGATSREEFAEITAAADAVDKRTFDLDIARFAVGDHRLLNPALWNAS